MNVSKDPDIREAGRQLYVRQGRREEKSGRHEIQHGGVGKEHLMEGDASGSGWLSARYSSLPPHGLQLPILAVCS